MNATVVERDLVEAIESTLFIYPSVPGLLQDLGIPGLRGRITKLSHPLANLCGDARFSQREANSMIEKVRNRYGDLAFGWLTGPSTRPVDLPARLEIVVLREEAPDRIGQELLLFVVIEVHSPSVIFAMMLRWISFDPA